MQIRVSCSQLARSGLLLVISACASSGQARYAALRNDYAATEARLQRGRARAADALAGETLERGALIRAVLDRNPSLEAGRQAWRAALAHYRQAGTIDEPMIELAAAPLSFASSSAPIGYEVGIRQRIPLGGKLGAEAELAIVEAQAAHADYDALRPQLALAASQLYDDYCLAVRSAAINGEHVALLHALQQSALAAYEAGRGEAQDSLQADAELAQLEYEAVQLATRRAVAIAQLNALLHRDPRAPLPPPPAQRPGAPAADDEAPPRSAGAVPLDGAPARDAAAVSRRPELAAARARVQVEAARAHVAERDGWPDLTLATSYNSMWEMPEHRWMAGVELSIPFERERRAGAIEQARAQQAAATHEAERMLDDARSEAAVAELHVEEARAALRLYEQRLIPLARERINAVQASYVASHASFAMLVDAEHDLRAAELATLALRSDLDKRSAELTRALGGMPGLTSSEVQP